MVSVTGTNDRQTLKEVTGTITSLRPFAAGNLWPECSLGTSVLPRPLQSGSADVVGSLRSRPSGGLTLTWEHALARNPAVCGFLLGEGVPLPVLWLQLPSSLL